MEARAARPQDIACARATQQVVLFYARFKDDGIIVFDASFPVSRRRAFFQEFCRRSAEFKVEASSVSRTCVQMLDLEIFKGARFSSSGRLDYRLFTKQTNIWQPLDVVSSHPKAVMHWPRAQLQRIVRRFTNAADAGKAIQKYRAMLNSYGVPVPVNLIRSRTATDKGRCWLVFPFHRAWESSRFLRAIKGYTDADRDECTRGAANQLATREQTSFVSPTWHS